MDDHQGDWIKLYRRSVESEVFSDGPVWIVWTFLLMRANFKRRRLMTGEWLEAGELITSVARISDAAPVTKKQTRRSLKLLENAGNIAQKRAKRGTHITICNWRLYQDKDTLGGQAGGQAEGMAAGAQPMA